MASLSVGALNSTGHGFKKKANIDFYLEREAMFVEQYLLGQDKH
jgi:hypothetical protein